MSKRLTIGDLNRRGDNATLSGPEGTIDVWVQKLTPVEQDEAFRRARAKRAVVLTASRDKDSDHYQAALCDAYDLGDRPMLVEFLIGPVMATRTAQIEAEVAAAEEWSADEYLEGLKTAWEGGLEERALDDPDDAEAARVQAEVTRFTEQVNERLDALRVDLREEWKHRSDDDVAVAVAELLLESSADQAFNDEYTRCEFWKGTRKPEDHSVRVFPHRDAVDEELQGETYVQLALAFAKLHVDVVSGKGSPGNPASSTSSELPDAEATAPSSGLAAVAP